MKTTGLAKAFAGGIASRVITAGLQFICAPLFLRLLGKESYGVVGFYYTLIAVSQLLDLGLSATINREIARRREDPSLTREMTSVLFSLERLYLTLSAIVTVVMVALAPYLAQHYLHRQFMSQEALNVAMFAATLAVGLQFPLTFYQGIFIGLERQGTVNLLNILFGVPRIAGALILVLFVSKSVAVFLACQGILSALQVVVYVFLTWRTTGLHRREGSFNFGLVKNCGSFMTNAGIASAVSSLLTQVDKLLVPKLMTLADAGLYSLISGPIVAITMIGTAVFMTFFPRMVRLIAANDREKVTDLYHKAAHSVTVANGAIALTLVLLAHRFLWAWTGDVHLADQLSLPLQLLCLAYMLNGLLVLPWTLMMANNIVWICTCVSVAAGVFAVPLIIFLTRRSGLVGPPEACAVVNVGMLAVGTVLMHRRALPGQFFRWLLLDTTLPMLAMAATGTVAAYAIGVIGTHGRLLIVIEMGLVAAMIALAGMMAGPARDPFLAKIRRRLPG